MSDDLPAQAVRPSGAAQPAVVARRPIAVHDLTWLHMDAPGNLMHVTGVMTFAEQPDWGAVLQVMQERMVDRYPVLRSRPALRHGRWVWEELGGLTTSDRVRRATLGGTGDVEEARRLVGRLMSEPFDRTCPLWDAVCVDDIADLAGPGRTGSMLVVRFHHGVADGIRLVQLLLSLADPDGGEAVAGIPRVGRGRTRVSPWQLLGRTALDALETASAARHVLLEGGLPRVGDVPGILRAGQPRGTGTRLAHRVGDLIERLAAASSVTNTVTNTLRSVSRLLLEPRTPALPWAGRPQGRKGVAWFDDVDLDAVRAAGRRHGASVTDTVLVATSRACTRYLRERGAVPPSAVNMIVPVSLRPFDETPTGDTLGNYFALVLLRLPLLDPATTPLDETFAAVQAVTTRTKHSAEPAVTLAVQALIATAPRPVARWITHFVAHKAVGQYTSVPGPGTPVAVAGTRVESVLGWVPMTGDQTLGVCSFSYAGRLAVGVSGDLAAIPDVGRLADLLREELLALG